MFLFENYKFLQNQLNVSVENSKQRYYSKLLSKLANPAKSYWPNLETFLNDKKINSLPPLFHENKFMANFKEKVELLILFLQTNALYWTTAVSCPAI